MGDTTSIEERKNFEDKLQMVEKIEDVNFGYVDIFRFKQPPYEYIMDFQKAFIDGDNRYEAYSAFLQQLQQKQHKNLAKVHMSQIQNHVCIKDTKVHAYCNYYNFTLKQAIEKKKMKGSRFSQAQLTYIMCCLMDLAVYLKNNGIVLGDYRLQKIFLSPQGYIKVYTLQIQKQNKHTAYYKALADKTLIDEMILAPEQLYQIQKLEYDPGFDIYKVDVFAIGMIILELMTLDRAKFYYTEEKTNLKMGRISFDLASFSTAYSPFLLNILRNCLAENQRQRATFESALYHLQQLRKRSQNVSYCIRLHDDELLKKSTVHSTKGQYILAGIQKRLTPSPITTLASSSSTFYYQSPHNVDEAKERFYR